MPAISCTAAMEPQWEDEKGRCIACAGSLLESRELHLKADPASMEGAQTRQGRKFLLRIQVVRQIHPPIGDSSRASRLYWK